MARARLAKVCTPRLSVARRAYACGAGFLNSKGWKRILGWPRSPRASATPGYRSNLSLVRPRGDHQPYPLKHRYPRLIRFTFIQGKTPPEAWSVRATGPWGRWWPEQVELRTLNLESWVSQILCCLGLGAHTSNTHATLIECTVSF